MVKIVELLESEFRRLLQGKGKQLFAAFTEAINNQTRSTKNGNALRNVSKGIEFKIHGFEHNTRSIN
jgi:hypothetical protein